MTKRWILALVLLFVLQAGVVQAAPERIVSLAPSITENLFALGAGERVVGVTSWCDYPEQARQKTVIGDAMNLNIELLLSLEPDLVIGDSTLVASHIETLESLGIPVFVIGPSTVAEVQASLVELGEAVGEKENGQRLAEAMELRLAELAAGVRRTEKTRVFMEIWNEPLMTVGPGSFMHELIVLAGGRNIAEDSPTPWPVYSEELVIERDPEVVILTSYNLAEALSRSAWQVTTAMKNGDVYEVNPDLYSRTTPRLLDALAELIDILDRAGN
ncbi:MAG: ABC transporter substrate-binding protein [Firmicutes bacterium]|nr:ABC transporter substrate-binding protein [Bacillota bacterium]